MSAKLDYHDIDWVFDIIINVSDKVFNFYVHTHKKYSDNWNLYNLKTYAASNLNSIFDLLCLLSFDQVFFISIMQTLTLWLSY